MLSFPCGKGESPNLSHKQVFASATLAPATTLRRIPITNFKNICVYDSDTDTEKPVFSYESLSGAIKKLEGKTVPIMLNFVEAAVIGKASNFSVEEGCVRADLEIILADGDKENPILYSYMTIGIAYNEDDDSSMIISIGNTNNPTSKVDDIYD